MKLPFPGFQQFLCPWWCVCVAYLCCVQRVTSETLVSTGEGVSDSTLSTQQNRSRSEGEVIESLDIADVTPTVLDRVSDGVVFSQVESSHVEALNEVINNDTPIVISGLDGASEELQKQAETFTPLGSILEASKIIENITNETPLVTNSEATNTTQNTTEDIPSFSEWTQKRLEEAEKKQQVNLSTSNGSKNTKVRWKNYASVDCGAKVILANPEAQHTWAILVGSRDEYALNPCSSRIWFIVELCEAIQLKKVELANYELFSSSPREFSVFVSDRFPTRDWSQVGQFTAEDQRDVQDFYVETETFGKYVKVEIKSHYGSEHYCPLSLFRAYGTSVFEVLQKEDPGHEQRLEEDDDDDVLDLTETVSSNNLLSSATDAVISMVKKAAQVLGNKVGNVNQSSQRDVKSEETVVVKSCNSPSHYVICSNCPDTLFGKIFELLSCKQKYIKNLISVPFIRHSLERSAVCQAFGLDFQDNSSSTTLHSDYLCVESFFPPSFLGAMCNALAVAHHKVHYNVSYQFPNGTAKENIINVAEFPEDDETKLTKPTEPLNVDLPDIVTKAGCSTDTVYTAQIKPTRSLGTDLPLHLDLNTSQLVTEHPEDVQTASVETDVEEVTEAPADVQAEVAEESADSAPSVSNAPSVGSVPGQKESVFLRQSNRIKALERNMSLSIQYLEELSKRYKKQVEEMQRVIEKTETTVRDVSATIDERFKELEHKLEHLRGSVETLSAEMANWKCLVHSLLLVLGATFLGYAYRRVRTPGTARATCDKSRAVQRRNSVDVVIAAPPKKKKRRPSDQALKIVTSASGDQSRKRRKKTSVPSKCADESSPDWVEGRGRVIEDVPFPLEDADSSVEGLPPPADEFKHIDPPGYVKTARQFRLGRSSFRNGNAVEERTKRHSSPVVSLDGSVGSDSSKKERRGLRKLLKKVF